MNVVLESKCKKKVLDSMNQGEVTRMVVTSNFNLKPSIYVVVDYYILFSFQIEGLYIMLKT